MKGVLAIVILAALGYYGYLRTFAPRAEATVTRAEAPRYGGSGFKEGERHDTSNPAFYATFEYGGPVLRLKPELRSELQAIAPGSVVLFATSWCPYCAKVRAQLKRERMPYVELDVEKDLRAKAFFEDKMDMHGYPVTVIGTRVVIGSGEDKILESLREL